ncbi:MAG: hypothetical protein ABW039_12985 [Sphingobium sp.]
MVRSQIMRDAEQGAMSRAEFLDRLGLRTAFHRISGRDDPRFARALELLNKTNQFHTTGRRWIAPELDAACRAGIVLAGHAADRHADYGLVLVSIATEGCIDQLVLSCRVAGLGVEIAAVAQLTEAMLRTETRVRALTVATDADHLSRDLFERCGWSREDDGDWWTQAQVPMPPHIGLEVSAG